MASQIDKAVKVFKSVAQYPSPTSARVLRFSGSNNGITIVSSWSQRNLDRKTSIKFQQTHFVDTSLQKSSNMLPTDITYEILSCLSKSEQLRGVVREITAEAKNKQQYLEIWQKGQLWKHFDLAALDVHGDVYHDADFGAFEWSPCEQKILYIAEKKLPKTEPFYKPTAQTPSENGLGDAKAKKGEEYVWRPDWGEQLVGKHQPVVGVCDMKTEALSVIDGIPGHVSPGQVVWSPNGDGIVGVAWSNEPRRLGLIYCTNRMSFIFHLNNAGVFRVLSDEGLAVRSPRFSPDGKYLVWLERPAGGVHHGAHRLMCCSWPSGEKETVVEIVRQQVKTLEGSSFFGIYNQSLSRRCWSEDSKRVIFSSPQECHVKTYVVHVETKSISELSSPKGSQSVLDVCKDIVVCSRSSLKRPAMLVLARLPSYNSETDLKWEAITDWEGATELDSMAVRYLALSDSKDPDAICKDYNAIYFGPDPESCSRTDVPLIVWPHGGPHSVFCDAFMLETALMVQLGFAMLMVNFRGSIGAGQDAVEFLPGRIGDTDVRDVQHAKNQALEHFPFLGPKKVVLFGGSHGGFLVTHLSGQYPTDYQAVVARNSVIDVATMYSISDIPDWTAVESGLLYSDCNEMSIAALDKMRKCSPINYVKNVIAPTLLLVGRKDQRVPDSQSIHYYHTLKANNVKTRLHSYDDCHPLGQCAVEMDNLINSAIWFLEHTA